MRALKIYIVEDEPLIVSTIETALKKQGHTVCGEADNFEEAKRQIESMLPDLVLVDIQLEGKTDGVDLATHLDAIKMPYLYITSQTDPNTIERVKTTKPIGYIVKPFTEVGLTSTIEVAWSNHNQQHDAFLAFTSNNQEHKLKQSQIVYLQAFDNYCYIFTHTQKYLVSKTLKHVLAQLDPEKFTKCHRSYAVNLSKITSISSHSVLLNTIKLPMSQNHKEKIRAYFG